MTTSEDLNKIKAKCEQLLELAAKRTPGKWGKGLYLGSSAHVSSKEVKEIANCHSFKAGQDASFIASCAGPAEAGWRATIRYIDFLNSILDVTDPYFADEDSYFGSAIYEASQLIAAWPDELL